MAKIKVFCLNSATEIIIFGDEEKREIKKGNTYYVDDNYYEDVLIGISVYEWDEIVYKFWDLGFFLKKDLITLQEWREQQINKILEND